jgi:hypothetical protein
LRTSIIRKLDENRTRRGRNPSGNYPIFIRSVAEGLLVEIRCSGRPRQATRTNLGQWQALPLNQISFPCPRAGRGTDAARPGNVRANVRVPVPGQSTATASPRTVRVQFTVADSPCPRTVRKQSTARQRPRTVITACHSRGLAGRRERRFLWWRCRSIGVASEPLGLRVTGEHRWPAY